MIPLSIPPRFARSNTFEEDTRVIGEAVAMTQAKERSCIAAKVRQDRRVRYTLGHPAACRVLELNFLLLRLTFIPLLWLTDIRFTTLIGVL